MDLQVLSQCGSTSNCLCRYVPEIHSPVAGTLSKQPANNSSVCSTFARMEDNSSQREYTLSVRLLSLCKPGLTSSLIGSPWFCGATTQSQRGQASIDGHHDAFAEHHLSCFVCPMMRVTSYTHLATVEKICSATDGSETRR